MKNSLASSVIMEMQIKTTRRYHLNLRQQFRSLMMLSFREHMDQQNFLYTAGGSVSWYKHFGKQDRII